MTSQGLLIIGVQKQGGTGSIAATLPLSGGEWQMHAVAPAPDALNWAGPWTWTGTQLLVMSGEPEDTESTVQSYDPATDTWTLLPPAPLAPRPRVISLWKDGEWLVWGGGNGSAAADDGVAFNPTTNTYRSLDESPLSHMA